MGLWLGNIPESLYLYGKNGDDLIIPYGCLSNLLKLCPEAKVVSTFIDAPAVDFRCKVPLYDYQKEALAALQSAYYGILQSPAGSGKTQIGIALTAALGKKTLWLTHTLDLVKQSRERAQLYMSNDLIGEISRGKVNIGKGITFATVQTMDNLDLRQYRDEWDCIIVDECHRVSGTPTAMTRFYRVLNALRARHKYGLSATVHRSDGTIAATYALLGDIAYAVPDEAVKDRVMKVSICPIATGVPISKQCMNTDGTLNFMGMLGYLSEHEARAKLVADYVKKNSEHSCLILSDRLDNLRMIMDDLPEKMRRSAVMVSGGMTTKGLKKEREKAIADMRIGKKKYLFATYQLAKEGLDIPCLDRLFLVTPHQDYAVVTQSIGRIARTHPGKDTPIVYDFVDSIPYLLKSYKTRCRYYRKNGCSFVEDDN